MGGSGRATQISCSCPNNMAMIVVPMTQSFASVSRFRCLKYVTVLTVKAWKKPIQEPDRVLKIFFPLQSATALSFTSQGDSAELVRFLLSVFDDSF